MLAPLCFDVGGVRLFGGGKGANVHVTAVRLQLRAELPFSHLSDTEEPSAAVHIGGPHVLSVRRRVDDSKVRYAVVRAATVSVINDPLGPFTEVQRPGKAMTTKNTAPPVDAYVSVAANATRDVTSANMHERYVDKPAE